MHSTLYGKWKVSDDTIKITKYEFVRLSGDNVDITLMRRQQSLK